MKTCAPVLLAFLFGYLFSVASSQICLGSAPDAQLVGRELVVNPDFESPTATAPWFSGDAEGFFLALSAPTGFPGEGSYSAVINTAEARACAPRPTAGIFQQVFLSQASPGLVFVSAWAKGVNVSGSEDANFSLYLDITFTNGSTLFGQFIPFPTDGEWNQVNLTLNETSPIDFFFLNLLFRNHTGTAYFDNVSVRAQAFMVQPLGENILANPTFANASCQLSGWTQTSNDTACTANLCGNFTEAGNASLTVTSNGTGACFNEFSQTVCFNPPLENTTLTFSVALSLLANATDSMNIEIFADANNFNLINIPTDATNGFQIFNATLTPNTTITAVDVFIRWVGTAGIAISDASLVLS